MKKQTITFHIVTIFPEAFASYLNSSLIKKAIDKKIIKINLVNPRDFAENKHNQVDDRPFGGGPGMILQVGPIFRAIKKIKSKIRSKSAKTRIILFSLKGKKFIQSKAESLAKYNNLILICGHYEGVDERVAKYIADEEISVGNFVLSGGEIPALLVVEAISRLMPGFLSNTESLEGKRSKNFGEKLASIPGYTRPEVFYPQSKKEKKFWSVPKILLSGNHREIENWQKKNMKKIS